MQINFDATRFNPSTGSDSTLFPYGEYLLEIAEAGVEAVKGNPNQGYVQLAFRCLEGPLQGCTQKTRFNIWHESEQPRSIANEQLSAVAHCIGRLHIQDTSQFVGGRLKAIIGPQAPPNETKYSEVKKYMDVNGNPPSKNGAAGVGQSTAPAAPGNPFASAAPAQQAASAPPNNPFANSAPAPAQSGQPAVDNRPPWLRN